MDISKIWKDFANTVVEAGIDSYVNIKAVCRTTFNMFKDTLIVAVKGISEWLIALVGGIASIIWDLIKVVGAGLVAAIKSTLGVLVEWLINWIKHL